MSVLSNWFKVISSWFKNRHDNKNNRVKALESCLRDGLDELIANTSQLAVDLNGARVYVWFEIDNSTAERVRHQVISEFRDDLRISVSSFWVSSSALERAFDCTLFILNDYDSYNLDRKLVKKFYKELCNKHHAKVKEAMFKKGLLD